METSKSALQKSRIHYRQLVEDLGDIIFTIDMKGNFAFISNQAKEIAGYKPEKMVGRNIKEFLTSKSVSVFEENFHRQLQGETLHPYEIEFTSGNGRQIPMEINTSLLFDTKGQFIAMGGIARDMTEHKRLEDELLQAHKMEMLGTLAGGVAHDFNNILHTISGFTEILLMGKTEHNPDYKGLIHIKTQTTHASELTQQLLTFSRKAGSQLQPLNLNSEIDKLKEIITRSIPRMIDIEFRQPDKLEPIKADPNQIEQIIMNLIINARDAMSSCTDGTVESPNGGKLIIRTENITLDEKYCRDHPGTVPGKYILLTVSDNGTGMDKNIIEHIFEPFYTTKKVNKGTGLGLAMVHGIVKNHNGYIQCHSVLGQGTTFKIYLPVLEVEEKIERTEQRVQEKIVGGTETILLVDDRNAILELGKAFLEPCGYTVITAETGEEAIEILSKAHDLPSAPDLVILDLNMPGMGGYECLKQLLKMDPDTNIIIASGYSTDFQKKKIYEIGAKGFIAKPYQMKQVQKMVRQMLDEDSNPTQPFN